MILQPESPIQASNPVSINQSSKHGNEGASREIVGTQKEFHTYEIALPSQSENSFLIKIVQVAGKEIGIFRFKDKYFAYENECAHEGGPVAEGTVVGHLECRKSSDKKSYAEFFSEERMDIVCPWHGIQYDLETGVCSADKRLKLISHQVIVENDLIKVRI